MAEEPITEAKRISLENASEFLKERHDAGDELAAFIMARLIRFLDIPDDHIPGWVAGFFVRHVGAYMDEYMAAEREDWSAPSLDEILGLAKAKSTRWTRQRRNDIAHVYRYMYDSAVKQAEAGKCNEFVGRSGKSVAILNAQGQPTQDFQIELLRTVGIAKGNSRDAAYKRARRLLRTRRCHLPPGQMSIPTQ